MIKVYFLGNIVWFIGLLVYLVYWLKIFTNHYFIQVKINLAFSFKKKLKSLIFK